MGKGQHRKNNATRDFVEDIRRGDEQAFRGLFFDFYHDLFGFARHMTQSDEQAKDIVQEVFYKLWKRRKKWTVHSSLKAYLFQSVRNEALNQISNERRRRDMREKFAVYEESKYRQAADASEGAGELITQIWTVVSNMPERRQSVFVLHRKHGLKYHEIAQILHISPKTVENHMGLALKEIRNTVERENS